MWLRRILATFTILLLASANIVDMVGNIHRFKLVYSSFYTSLSFRYHVAFQKFPQIVH